MKKMAESVSTLDITSGKYESHTLQHNLQLHYQQKRVWQNVDAKPDARFPYRHKSFRHYALRRCPKLLKSCIFHNVTSYLIYSKRDITKSIFFWRIFHEFPVDGPKLVKSV